MFCFQVQLGGIFIRKTLIILLATSAIVYAIMYIYIIAKFGNYNIIISLMEMLLLFFNLSAIVLAKKSEFSFGCH